jgi:rhamnosyltransferase
MTQPEEQGDAGATVIAAVVTFNPDRARLQQLLQSTRPQVDAVVLVDNGSTPDCLRWLRELAGPALQLIELGANRGIAAAQNAGIEHARVKGCSHVLLLDHDSVPAPMMVADLLSAAARVRPQGRGVAAVGPRYIDERQANPPPFIRVRGLRVERCACPTLETIVEVDYLISSGSLIPMATLEAVGPMAEELFIDYVDIEWGMRARRLGFQSYGVCAAQMAHDLGEAPVRFMGRNLPVHSALRHYYHFRNAVWLYRSPDLPLHWKLADGWRLLLKYGFYTLFAKPRLDHLRMMSRGIVDGLRGRLGAYGGGASASAASAAAAGRS